MLITQEKLPILLLNSQPNSLMFHKHNAQNITYKYLTKHLKLSQWIFLLFIKRVRPHTVAEGCYRGPTSTKNSTRYHAAHGPRYVEQRLYALDKARHFRSWLLQTWSPNLDKRHPTWVEHVLSLCAHTRCSARGIVGGLNSRSPSLAKAASVSGFMLSSL